MYKCFFKKGKRVLDAMSYQITIQFTHFFSKTYDIYKKKISIMSKKGVFPEGKL